MILICFVQGSLPLSLKTRLSENPRLGLLLCQRPPLCTFIFLDGFGLSKHNPRSTWIFQSVRVVCIVLSTIHTYVFDAWPVVVVKAKKDSWDSEVAMYFHVQSDVVISSTDQWNMRPRHRSQVSSIL